MRDNEPIGVPEYTDYVLMKTMGWDWHTLQSQPAFVIDYIIGFYTAEMRAESYKLRKHGAR